jgi:hypothetical protein
VIAVSIPGSFSDLPVASCWHILVDCNGERITGFIPSFAGSCQSGLLTVVLLPLSDVAMPQDMPASGVDPGYNKIVANHLNSIFKNRATYDAFAISAFRGVHSLKGWAWMTCVRFEDNGHPRTYAVFIQDGKVIDSRYAVQIDACNTETYAAFDAMGPSRAGVLGPLY